MRAWDVWDFEWSEMWKRNMEKESKVGSRKCRFIKYGGVALPESLLEGLCHIESPQ